MMMMMWSAVYQTLSSAIFSLSSQQHRSLLLASGAQIVVSTSPTFELDDLQDYYRFNEFVYSVLLAHNNSIKSSTFDIWYHDPYIGRLCFPNVIKWSLAPWNQRTLVLLKIYGFTVNGFSSIRLPSLKTLHFQDAIFLNARDLLLLLVGCQFLEDFKASNLWFHFEDYLSCQECQSLSLSKLTKAEMLHTFCHYLVPQCISLHLKTCTLWYFGGRQSDLQSCVLQTMKICCRDSLKKDRELSLCSMASLTCELIFHVFKLRKKESLSD